ncbi:MAG TPA: phospholipid carrier-dependent glycosyltransferase, partial [Ktedonobacterales bacterium]|nr:phospholipid carrier-dependent glycosyltransferase [Ktedonobacterales bacterium]
MATVEIPNAASDERMEVAFGPGQRVWQMVVAERVTIGVSLVALAARLWGIGFGLPYAVHPDEPVVNGTVVSMLQRHAFDPATYIYPSLLYYVLAAIALLYQGVTGTTIGMPPDQTGLGLYPNPDAVLWMRIGVALLCVVAVTAVYRVGRTLVGPWAALGGALLLAFSPLHIIQSQIATTDGVSATGMVLVAATSVWAVRSARREAFWAAGVALGVAAGIKYQVAIGGVMLLAAYGIVLLRRRRAGETLSARTVLRDPRLLAFALAPLAFLITTPYAVLNWPAFLNDVDSVFLHYGVEGHLGVAGSSLVFTLQEMFAHNETLLSVLAVVGLLHALLRRRTEMLIVAMGALAYFILVASPKVHFERNLVPLWPLLALLAAEGILWVGGLLAAFAARPLPFALTRPLARPAVRGTLLGLLLLAAFLPTLGRTIQQNTIRSEPDVQATASTWINAHVPAGAKIAYESYSVTLDPRRFQLIYLRGGLYTEPLSWYSDQGIQYVVASQMFYYRFYTNGPTDFPAERGAYAAMFD